MEKVVKINNLNWMIGGEAGYGIMNSAAAFAKYCLRSGLYTFLSHDYPSLIRGGHNASSVRVSEKEVASHDDHLDILIALNSETIDKHINQIDKGGYLVYDSDQNPSVTPKKEINLIPINMHEISKKITDKKLLVNSIALGITIALTNSKIEPMLKIVSESYSGKSKEIIESNLKAVKEGYDFIKKNFKGNYNLQINPTKQKNKRYILSGNEAIALGAINAGCKFLSQYPMTPTSQILTFMSQHAKEFGLVVMQPEDEIASIHLAIGASYAGIRAMTATSGGGFSLMSEGFGLAGITEVPIVVVNGQRGGPATGLPTKNEQSDLKLVTNSGQGEITRIVIAPSDVKDAFNSTIELFNLTDKFQVPGILLVDKYTCSSSMTIENLDLNKPIERGQIISQKDLDKIVDFKRYNFSTLNGVSPRPIPGQKNGLFNASSDEHDEFGQISETPENRIKMMEKRLKKQIFIKQEFPKPELIGDKNADITLVGWGGTKGAISEAISILEEFWDLSLNQLHIKYILPFQSEEIKSILAKSKRVIIVEGNYTGQLSGLIREKTGIEIKDKILRFDGKPFTGEDISQKVLELLKIKR